MAARPVAARRRAGLPHDGGHGDLTRRRGAGAALIAASAVYVVLIAAAAANVGANYEEIVPYVLTGLDIRDSGQAQIDHDSTPRFVESKWLPRLAFEPIEGLRLPLLSQLYMTDHLSYGGVALAAAGIDPLWAARLWHALFGLVLLWLLYDVAILLGLGVRAALIAVVTAATSLQLAACYAVARFDESLASFASVAVLWAALRYSREGRQRWIGAGVVVAAFAVSAKLTALWPLIALAAAGVLAGWRPPPLRRLAWPALVAAPLFAPMVGFALIGPATQGEIGRRLEFLSDLFTSDAIPGTAANLINYLGSWGSIISQAMRGTEARSPDQVGRLLVLGTLVWLVMRSLARGTVPRRRRLESQMLAVAAVVYVFVVLFYREHRDYQFVLLVPLYTLAIAAFLDWCAERFLDRRLPRWAAGLIVCALPVGSNLWQQYGLHEDLSRASNAMIDLGSQTESAAWLAEHDVRHPIVTTFYAVGTYELFTNGAVRPIYAFPMFRHSNDRSDNPDLVAAWRSLLDDGAEGPHFAVVPVGQNPIEARHFDEPAIRAALLRAADGDRVAVFANPRGKPLLEIWRVTVRDG